MTYDRGKPSASRSQRSTQALAGSLAVALTLSLAAPALAGPKPVFGADRLPEDDIIYLVLPDRFENGDPSNDRGGLSGDRSVTGYDPTGKAYYHGGDLKGLTRRLDYIQNLGVTALWLTPVYTNKAVQGEGPSQSAGYHGYWPTNFLEIDPHLGTRADYKAFVEAAHARGMKVYFDVVINHTADVVKYRECTDRYCAYRSRADYPYTRHQGLAGSAINDGFTGDGAAGQTPVNFARLKQPDYAYTPFVPEAERTVKVPAWLNDVSVYHNRGESTFKGESSQFGDFAGLDDVMTENPRVVQGFIEIYGAWIDEFRLDGLRIDTARHVNAEFWQAFVPAMQARAKAKGIENFHIFGEVMEFDPGVLAKSTLIDRLPAVNDFALQGAIRQTVAEHAGTDVLARIFAGDVLYAGGEATARRLVTLTGNHDVLRLGRTLRSANPQASEDELLKRTILANAIILHARGIPALYYGDEQGFTGEGEGDQPSREDMMPSHVDSYNDNRLIGTTKTTAADSFDPEHPLYRAITEMTHTRLSDPALRRGDQLTRFASPTPGIFAFSRLLPGTGETLVAVNTSTEPQDAQILVETASTHWTSVHGACASDASAPGSYHITLPPLSYIVCKAAC